MKGYPDGYPDPANRYQVATAERHARRRRGRPPTERDLVRIEAARVARSGFDAERAGDWREADLKRRRRPGPDAGRTGPARQRGALIMDPAILFVAVPLALGVWWFAGVTAGEWAQSSTLARSVSLGLTLIAAAALLMLLAGSWSH
ncbi:MAG: hypothetical protein KF842_06950 [Caulobacter sp.]|nr:hypothetical protein [Caulobacter sp.]